jgi:Fe-S cluster assembly protein SufD
MSSLDRYAAEWDRIKQQRGHRDAISRIREDAWRRFVSRGFPTTRDEEWRFTSVTPIAEREFTLAPPNGADHVGIDAHRLPDASAAELVFVNGHYVHALSRLGALPHGCRVGSLAASISATPDVVMRHLSKTASSESQPFVALNTAFLDDGAFIELPAGAIVEAPIHLLFLTTAQVRLTPDTTSADDRSAMTHPRLLVILGANSQASIVETYAGPAGTKYFTNTVSEIVVGANAVLNHVKLQYEGADAFHVSGTHVDMQRSGTYVSNAISLGGGLVRNDIAAVLGGDGVDCTLNGLYYADADRFVDNHTAIDHAQPHCGSREIYKGILADRARGVFNGKIIVRPDAQKTDAKQTNRALLLSEDARINTKPQLEIFANDVKCTHGAAVGQLDDEALFYLRSRGLSQAAARDLLIRAFAADVLNRMPIDAVRSSVEARLQQQLARALPSAA